MLLEPAAAPAGLLLLLLLLGVGGACATSRPPLYPALKAVQALKGRNDALIERGRGREGVGAAAAAAAERRKVLPL